MISKKQVRFVDIAHSMNVHIFIIWEFIRKFGYERGTRKDKYGRGYVSAVQCRKWIHKLKEYIDEQDFTYKQEFNKRQYLYRDENKFAEEKRNGQDVPREYSVDKYGNIVRYTWLSKNRDTGSEWKWDADLNGWTFVQVLEKA